MLFFSLSGSVTPTSPPLSRGAFGAVVGSLLLVGVDIGAWAGGGGAVWAWAEPIELRGVLLWNDLPQDVHRQPQGPEGRVQSSPPPFEGDSCFDGSCWVLDGVQCVR